MEQYFAPIARLKRDLNVIRMEVQTVEAGSYREALFNT